LLIEADTETSIEQAIAQFKKDLEKYKDRELKLLQGQNELLIMIDMEEREHPENIEKLQKAKHYVNNELKNDIDFVHEKIVAYDAHIAALEKRLHSMKRTREETQVHATVLEQKIAEQTHTATAASGSQDVDLEEAPFIASEQQQLTVSSSQQQQQL